MARLDWSPVLMYLQGCCGSWMARGMFSPLMLLSCQLFSHVTLLFLAFTTTSDTLFVLKPHESRNLRSWSQIYHRYLKQCLEPGTSRVFVEGRNELNSILKFAVVWVVASGIRCLIGLWFGKWYWELSSNHAVDTTCVVQYWCIQAKRPLEIQSKPLGMAGKRKFEFAKWQREHMSWNTCH